jgi:hypothetical protein
MTEVLKIIVNLLFDLFLVFLGIVIGYLVYDYAKRK